MTALREYARLESTGVWRESPDAQRRDVVVAFGDSTLVILDRNDRALAHWSLAAVRRANPGETPATFSPGADATETLEIEDATMVAAIDKVQSLIRRRRPQAGRLRGGLILGFLAVIAALAVFWMPGALLRYTVSLLPPSLRTEIGNQLQEAITHVSGQPCEGERGREALTHLSTRLFGEDGTRLVVVPDGVATVQHLPGGLTLIGHNLVEDHESPEVVAGYLLAETLRRDATDPMARLLRAVGLSATIRLLTTGEVPAERLSDYAEELLSAAPEAVNDDALLARFAAARIRSTPYARAQDITGEATLRLIEADPMKSGGTEPVLTDADWVSLQGICGG